MIHCCKCGTLTNPRLLNMCDPCAAKEMDLATNIKKQDNVLYCKKCDRYLSPPKTWIHYDLGSNDFLLFLLKKNTTLAKLNIAEANFEYTEEHSKRVLIKLDLRENNFEQSLILRIFVKYTQCPDCAKVEAKQYWQSKVQVRQKVKHKRTFIYLEQVMLKSGAHKDVTDIKEVKDGLDFCFQSKPDALRFVDFLQGTIGNRIKASSKLVSQDLKSNLNFFKYSFCIEIFPVCKDDLLYLDNDFASSISIANLVIVLRVTTMITVVDPLTLRIVDIGCKAYWSHEAKIHVLASSPEMREYTIVEIDKTTQRNGKYLLADVYLFKHGNTMVHCKSHLGNIVHEGDCVLGYDLSGMNTTLDVKSDFEVFLVRKKVVRSKKLKVKTTLGNDAEYDMFVEDLVGDEELRQKVNVYDEHNNIVLNLQSLNI